MWVDGIAEAVLGVFAPLTLCGLFLTAMVVVVAFRRHESLRTLVDRAAFGWSLSMLIGGLLLSLAAGAVLIGRHGEGSGGFVSAVVINVLTQPLCLVLVWGSAGKLYLAVQGRASYAGKVIPAEGLGADEYRDLCRYCIASGFLGLGVSVSFRGCGGMNLRASTSW
jgi:hypothetical protein